MTGLSIVPKIHKGEDRDQRIRKALLRVAAELAAEAQANIDRLDTELAVLNEKSGAIKAALDAGMFSNFPGRVNARPQES